MQRVYVVTSGAEYNRSMLLACQSYYDALECSRLYNSEETAERHVHMLPYLPDDLLRFCLDGGALSDES